MSLISLRPRACPPYVRGLYGPSELCNPPRLMRIATRHESQPHQLTKGRGFYQSRRGIALKLALGTGNLQTQGRERSGVSSQGQSHRCAPAIWSRAEAGRPNLVRQPGDREGVFSTPIELPPSGCYWQQVLEGSIRCRTMTEQGMWELASYPMSST